MNKHRARALALAALGLSCLPGAVAANEFAFSYTGPGVSGSGLITTGNAGSPYTVTGITGTANGHAITGLSSYAAADNLLYYPSHTYVDFSGVSFSTATKGDWGLGWTGAAYGIVNSVSDPGGACCGVTPLNVSVTQVANAKVFDFAYSGSGAKGSGVIATGGGASPYSILSISGTANGDAITGLSSYAAADNMLYFPTQPYVDGRGVSFSTVSHGDWGLGWTGSAYGIVNSVTDPTGACCGVTPLSVSLLQVSNAKVFDFSYSGSGVSGSGEIVTGASNKILSITGTANGDPITGLSSYAFADNHLYFPAQPFVDGSGLSFSAGSGGDWGLGWTGFDYGIVNSLTNPGGFCCGANPLFLTITQVPEPSAWVLILAGLGAVGGSLRRARALRRRGDEASLARTGA